MFTNAYRHNAYWGAPAMGFCYDSPRMDFGPRPMHHGNPFASFMGGFFGGLGIAAACGWGNSYVSYPSASVSIFPGAYPAYQRYSAVPTYSFGVDYSALALNDAFARFVDSFSMPRYMNAPTQIPTSNWTMPTQPSNYWSTPAPAQTWSQPFSSLTQSGRQSGSTYSIIPPRPKTQASAQAGNSQPQSSGSAVSNTYTPIPVKNAATAANQNSQTVVSNPGTQANNASKVETPPSVQAVDTGSANVTEIRSGDSLLIIGDASKGSALNESSALEAAKAKGMNVEVQKYQEIMSGMDKTSKPSLENVDTHLYNNVVQYQQMTLSAMQEGNTAVINDHLNSLSFAVKKYQEAYPIPEPPKDAATIKAEEDAYNAKCHDGIDCGDYSDRLYYDDQKCEWLKSTKIGYPRQPIAPESTMVQIPEQYTTDKSGIKYYANPEALKHFIEMSDVAFAQRGIQMTIKSAYRRLKDQEKEFEADQERIRKLKAEGYKPAPKAAPPGYSEHHKGDAFDLAESSPINVRNDGDFQTDENGKFVLKDGKRIPVAAHIKWLEKNGKFFGFELSYPPKNKLGVTAEGWHWRFNPELAEKYKQQREELVEKYKPEVVEG